MSSETRDETLEKDSKKKLLAAEEAAEKNRDAEHDEDESDDEEEEEEESNALRRPRRVRHDPAGEKAILNRPSSAKMIWTLTKREIGAYMSSAITYIVIAVTLVVFGLYFSSTRAASGRSTAPRWRACSTRSRRRSAC